MFVLRDGAPTERKRELLTYWLYLAAERVINALPRRAVMPVAAAVGNLAYDLAGPKRQVIHENLAHPMGLDPDHRRVRSAARRAFRNYAKYLVDMMRIGELSPAAAADLVHIENIEVLDAARAQGKGVLVCTIHVGGMDMIGPGLKLRGDRDARRRRRHDLRAPLRPPVGRSGKAGHPRHRLAQPARALPGAARQRERRALLRRRLPPR